jgi:hypothetical protein
MTDAPGIAGRYPIRTATAETMESFAYRTASGLLDALLEGNRAQLPRFFPA